MGVDPPTRAPTNATGAATMAVTGLWLFGLLMGASWWLPAMIVGYAFVVPVVSQTAGQQEAWRRWQAEDEPAEADRPREEPVSAGASAEPGRGAESTRDALETLRDRYARGELTDEQFERKLELLLETDTLENASEWTAERRRGTRTRERSEDDKRPDPEFES